MFLHYDSIINVGGFITAKMFQQAQHDSSVHTNINGHSERSRRIFIAPTFENEPKR